MLDAFAKLPLFFFHDRGGPFNSESFAASNCKREMSRRCGKYKYALGWCPFGFKSFFVCGGETATIIWLARAIVKINFTASFIT